MVEYYTPPYFTKFLDDTSKIKTYVGSDGKLHFVNKAGADTVLNFSGVPTFTYVVGKVASYSSISFNLEKDKTYLVTAQSSEVSNEEVYMDLNMNNMTGIEILQTLNKSDTFFSNSRVKWYIVKTTSNTVTLNAQGGIAIDFIKLN